MTTKCDILVVDDDPDISRVVESMLSNDGYRVDVAGSDKSLIDHADHAISNAKNSGRNKVC